MSSDIKWIAAVVSVCAVCAAVWFFISGTGADGGILRITQDGKVITEIDMSSVEEPYEFDIEASDGGYNTIRIENGRAAVTDADCPDRLCVGQGYVRSENIPIVCLPHRLVIEIADADEGPDAVSGGGFN